MSGEVGHVVPGGHGDDSPVRQLVQAAVRGAEERGQAGQAAGGDWG